MIVSRASLVESVHGARLYITNAKRQPNANNQRIAACRVHKFDHSKPQFRMMKKKHNTHSFVWRVSGRVCGGKTFVDDVYKKQLSFICFVSLAINGRLLIYTFIKY